MISATQAIGRRWRRNAEKVIQEAAAKAGLEADELILRLVP